ncbi:hypothetical protein [Streptomyces sp. NPDC016845]|uniref:hypothetical protein n=1 Tax=Streptomyces sp. NPDC016845 TaxID=3364972 RepID=UPI00378C2F4B
MSKKTQAQEELDATVDRLPTQVAGWNPDQCREFADASNAVMREQTYGTTPALGQRQ